MKHRLAIYTGAVLLIATATGWLYHKKFSGRSKHLLLITVDALRADRLGCYGYKSQRGETFKALAKESLVFDNAFTTMPTTQPAMGSIFTSLYPSSHGVRKNGIQLPDEALTLAEILKQNGWKTVAFVSAFPLDQRFKLNQGFDVYRDSIGAQGKQKNLKFEVDAQHLTRAVVKWLNKNRDLPQTFLWVHYFDPHAPYKPPERFSKDAADTKAAYDGEIAYLDEQLGVLFMALNQHGFLQDALTILVSDHGEGFGEHGYKGHGWFLYDEVVRVPLLISGRGIEPGRTGNLTQHVDLAPGILDYFGLPVPRQFQGTSWWRIDRGSVPPRERVWLERRLPPIPNAGPHEDGQGAEEKWALRTRNEKFIWSSDGHNELYDLAKDPGEKQNLYSAGNPKAIELERLGLLQKKQLLKAALTPKTDMQQQDEETREALKALGYVN